MKRPSMATSIRNYIAYRTNMGYKDSHAATLKAFARFADKNYPGEPLTIRLAIQWSQEPHPKKTSPKYRLSYLRQLAKYLIVRDPDTELIPHRILDPRVQRYSPYILSQSELLLFLSTRSYTNKQNISERTIKTVLGLLACTGMRISEAVMLKNGDIDWKNGMIVIRNIKRRAMRLLPLDPSAMAKLRSYKKLRDAFYPDVKTDRFFLLDKGKPITAGGVWARWRSIWNKMDKTKMCTHKCPRLHDLRHTFACNHLLDAYRKKKNIDRELHILSVYLGHVKVSSTYWYLTATSELLEHVSLAFEKYVNQTRKKSS